MTGTAKILKGMAKLDGEILLWLIEKHYPITRPELRKKSGLSVSEFRRAMAEISGKYWNVGGELEPIGKVAKL